MRPVVGNVKNRIKPRLANSLPYGLDLVTVSHEILHFFAKGMTGFAMQDGNCVAGLNNSVTSNFPINVVPPMMRIFIEGTTLA